MRQRFLSLYSLLFMIYLLLIAVNFASSDAQVMVETSREIAFQQTIALPENYSLPQIYRGADQRWYSQYDPGLPILAAPLVWLSDSLAQSQKWHRYNFSAYVVRFLSAGFAALAVHTIFSLAQALYHNDRTAIIIAFAAGFCTPVLVYSRMFFAEATLAGLLTFSFYAVYRKRWFWAGLAFGLAILIRAAMLIYLLPLLWLMVRSIMFQSKGLKPPCLTTSLTNNVALAHCFQFLIFPALAVIALLYHNQFRNGDALMFGYGGQGFDTPLYVGIAGFLFSPGKSLFLYAPPLILSIPGARSFYRRHPALAESLLLAVIIALLFYGRWWAWHGGWCWGPRLLVPIIPLLLLPMGNLTLNPSPQLERDFHTPLSTRGEGQGVRFRLNAIVVSIILLFGFLISIAGLVTDVNKYYALHEGYDMVNYNVEASPIVGAVRDVLAGENLITLAAFNLQDYGWAQSGAIAFPIILMFMLISSLLALIKEFARE